jgi:hypothetical protein
MTELQRAYDRTLDPVDHAIDDRDCSLCFYCIKDDGCSFPHENATGVIGFRQRIINNKILKYNVLTFDPLELTQSDRGWYCGEFNRKHSSI